MRTVALMIVLVATAVSAHSKVAVCSGSDASRWSNCFGTLTSPSGVNYVGEFRDGKYHGQGTSTFPDGRPAQTGIWENNRFVRAQPVPENMAGPSTPRSPTVARVESMKVQSHIPFCGTFMNRCSGAFKLTNGEYVGEFTQGMFHGQGTFTHANGDKYVGESKYGEIAGLGTFYSLADNHWKGDKYVGEFREGKFHGQGAYTFANGSPPLEGIWDNHTFVSAQRIPEYMTDRTPAKPASVATASRQAVPIRSSLALSVSTSQPDAEGVVTLTITTNSDTASLKINGDEAGGKEDGRYSIKKFVQLGNNVFDVVATDRFGNTQRQSASVTRRAADSTVRFAALNPTAVRVRPATNAVAIIIGIQDYSRVPKAEFANNDARVFYDYAIRGLGVRPENIKILLDQEANDIDILGAFKNWLPLKTRKGQTDVYVFYSGHGLPSDDGANLYVLPHGVDRQFLERTAIKQSELIASLQAVSPRSVTMFMDACYSGQIRTGETLLVSARPISIQSKASSYPANFNVISASAPDQLASSSPDLKHGVFSYFLMKGMEGEADENKDGNITMAEMQSYLKEYVGKKAMSLNRTQVPQLNGDQSRVLVSR
jgi:hypothetical protein